MAIRKKSFILSLFLITLNFEAHNKQEIKNADSKSKKNS